MLRPTINTSATIAIATHRSTAFLWEKTQHVLMHLWLVRLLPPVIVQAEQSSRYWRQVPQRPLYPTRPSFNEAWCLETYNIGNTRPERPEQSRYIAAAETMQRPSITHEITSDSIPLPRLPSVPINTPAHLYSAVCGRK